MSRRWITTAARRRVARPGATAARRGGGDHRGSVAARRGGGDRGSVAVETAVLAPAFIALMVLAGVAGRTAVGAEAVEAAAHDAARAASISRDADSARAAAASAAAQQLDWQKLSCTGTPTLAFSGSVGGSPTSFELAYQAAPGQPAAVTVQITCLVSFADIHLSTLPGMPGGRQVTASFTSPLDSYRSRG
ncbi:TadE/TadG family type IV pilus assembly protein [Micromonospora sp. WMMD882]|uniref:TadE/TadG family type IV pilus assembly protein n=1 Tax=Micromonospora sp. WMMD882 TaxID=3015151 RepID=UPI00248CDA8C|nr:TadE/TadG family type IV pilus assembly protein [Micromonospora sp. WMMD882]WBB78105.1 TadE/TadG family type IV pilus assembly protein [Micromonospora sp. WMMD882]